MSVCQIGFDSIGLTLNFPCVSGETRTTRLLRALANVIQSNPDTDVVNIKEVLDLDPELRKGHNGAARELAKRGFIQFQRRGGAKSSGTGNWIVTRYGRSIMMNRNV